jgi:O-antigen/teichoic acid export membrane protein
VSNDDPIALSEKDIVDPAGETVAPALNLGTHSARGMVYLFAGQGATKIVAFVTQILLLYLLEKDDFGVVTKVGTLTMFILIIGQSGIADVLVHRRAFRQWAGPGFWLALALGIFSCVLIALSAPIGAALYGSNPAERSQLFWLLIASVPMPLPYALQVLPKAQLSRELRFRALSLVGAAEVCLLNFFTLLFALVGFGAYSLVVSTTVGGLVLTVALWWWVKPPVATKLYLNRWRYLIGDSAQLLASEFGRMLVDQSDYMMLGLFHISDALVGVYNVGFRLSIQILRLLMVNMTTILFPAFTKLNDRPEQQYQGFFKAQRILALVGVSGCLLQAATADAFARLLLPEKWYSSIIVMQILSLGMTTRMVAGGSYALLKSHGRFKMVRDTFWVCAIVQVALLVLVLAMGGGIIAVSVVVSIVAACTGPAMFYLAVQPLGGGWADVADVLVRPLVIGIISVGIAWLIAQGMAAGASGRWLYLLQLVEICAVSTVLNAALARLWMRPVWDDLWLRIWRLLPSRATA